MTIVIVHYNDKQSRFTDVVKLTVLLLLLFITIYDDHTNNDNNKPGEVFNNRAVKTSHEIANS